MFFSEELKKKKEELGVSQKELCQLLYDVPHRTLQSWLKGDKEPPEYMQKLIRFKLSYEENKKKCMAVNNL